MYKLRIEDTKNQRYIEVLLPTLETIYEKGIGGIRNLETVLKQLEGDSK